MAEFRDWWLVVTSTSLVALDTQHPQRTSTTALFDYISAGRFTHGVFYHWRPHLSSDCCIGLEQFAGVKPGHRRRCKFSATELFAWSYRHD